MIKENITQDQSYELGILEPDRLIKTSASGTALIFELFDNSKQQIDKVITPLMPKHTFSVPYRSGWKLIVKFNGNPGTGTKFELKML